MHIASGLLLQWGPHRQPHGPMIPPDGAGGGMLPWAGTGAAGGGLGLLWWLVALMLLVAVVAVVAMLVLDLRDRESTDADALSVLRQRYAAGEIDEDEFDRRRRRLGGGQSS